MRTKMMRWIWIHCLAFLMMLSGLWGMLPEAVFAASIVDSGTAGAISWVLNSEGLLEFSGNGAIPDYDFEDAASQDAPQWVREYQDQILTVKIDQGITGIGNAAFQDCGELAAVSIPDSVTRIGENAFLYCNALKQLTVPESVTSIGADAFPDEDCTLLVTESSYALTYAIANGLSYEITEAGSQGGSSSILPRIKIDNTITASDVKKAVSSSGVKFTLLVSVEGDAPLTFSSNNNSIKVNKTTGEVTIAKNYIGKALITIQAGETELFNAAQKTITVQSVPATTSLVSIYNIKSKTAQLNWKRNKKVSGYQIQYSPSSDFSDAKTVTISKNKTVKTTIKSLSNKTTYYFRIRTYKTVDGVDYSSGWSKALSKKILSTSYDTKVYKFIHKKRYKNGAKWGYSQRPLISRYSGIGCCAYAADFFASITGNKKSFGKNTFKKPSKIRSGDVIKVLNKQHWFVVLYRNGSQLITAEGNWGGKVVISENAYTVKGNKLMRDGKKFRKFSIGYHSVK